MGDLAEDWARRAGMNSDMRLTFFNAIAHRPEHWLGIARRHLAAADPRSYAGFRHRLRAEDARAFAVVSLLAWLRPTDDDPG